MIATPSIKLLSRKKQAVFLTVVLFLGVACLVLLFRNSSPRVKYLDSRFKIVSVKLLQNSSYTNYEHSQFEVKLRNLLRRIGLPVKASQCLGLAESVNDVPTVCVSYKGDIPEAELALLRAELVDELGIVTPCAGGSAAFVLSNKKRVYHGTWSLSRTGAKMIAFMDPVAGEVRQIERQDWKEGNYRVRLKLWTNGLPLAEIDLGKITKKSSR